MPRVQLLQAKTKAIAINCLKTWFHISFSIVNNILWGTYFLEYPCTYFLLSRTQETLWVICGKDTHMSVLHFITLCVEKQALEIILSSLWPNFTWLTLSDGSEQVVDILIGASFLHTQQYFWTDLLCQQTKHNWHLSIRLESVSFEFWEQVVQAGFWLAIVLLQL